MNEAERILNMIQGRCKNLGIEMVKVAEIMIDSAPQVFYNNIDQYLERVRRCAKELYYRRLPEEDIEEQDMDDPDFDPSDYEYEIEEVFFFFFHNGVCNILEINEDGVTDY